MLGSDFVGQYTVVAKPFEPEHVASEPLPSQVLRYSHSVVPRFAAAAAVAAGDTAVVAAESFLVHIQRRHWDA